MRATLVAATTLALLVASTGSAATALSSSEHDLYLNFNGVANGSPNLANAGSALVTSEIVSAEGGRVAAEVKGNGYVARMEPFDPDGPVQLAVVVVRPGSGSDPLAPRTGSFTFGASFNLDSKSQGSAVDNGNNLVQRGLYGDGSQYKIQVDAGRVSCRVAGSGGSVVVEAGVTVKPGVWYRTRCTRDGSSVKLDLVEVTPDGPVSRSWSRSGTIGDLGFSKRPPLSVGGKVDASGTLVSYSADQFNGRVDDVFFHRLGG